jgi:hypothetical protein
MIDVMQSETTSGAGSLGFKMVCPECAQATSLHSLESDTWECAHCFVWWQTRPCARCHRHLPLGETRIDCSRCRNAPLAES